MGKGKNKKGNKKANKKGNKNKNKNKGNKKKNKEKKSKKTPTLSCNFGTFGLPFAVLADSYKAVHYLQYPEAKKMVAYGEFRKPYNDFIDGDARFVCYGIRYVVETYLLKQWTVDDVVQAKRFYKTHNALNTEFPFPEELFLRFIKKNDGWFPIKFQALPEGTVAHIHTPVYQITAKGKYSRLVTWFETLLTHVWYPCTVATLSRKCRSILQAAFEKSAADSMFLLESRLHDFGFRGTTSLQQAIIGGSAHLLSFGGSDTMAASYHVQYNLNGGKPVGTSIPATEHSVMTSWPSEKQAIRHAINTHGEGVFAVVMDTYDYTNALNNIMSDLKDLKEKKGGFMVYRPDSGDTVESVLEGLRAAEKTFGATVNAQGFKVLNGVGVIQGDGINVKDLGRIVNAVMEAGFAASNVAYGMGSGLLHKHNRDTMSFATKLSYIKYANGEERDVMKRPSTDSTKFSLPGQLKVIRNEQGIPITYPLEAEVKGKNILKTFYDCGPVDGLKFPKFDKLRHRVQTQWDQVPPTFDNLSADLKHKIEVWRPIIE